MVGRGLKAVLEQLAKAWRQDRGRIEESGDKVIEQLREYSSLGAKADAAGREVLERAFQGIPAARMFLMCGSAGSGARLSFRVPAFTIFSCGTTRRPSKKRRWRWC